MRLVTRLLLFAACSLLPLPAFAEPLELAWRACPGSPGASPVETFACNANGMPQGDPIQFRLVASFESPVALGQFTGIESILDVVTPGASPLPDWWRLAAGECREASLNLGLAYGAPGMCVTPFTAGSQVGGGLLWTSEYVSPNRARLRITVASDVVSTLQAGTRYTAFDLRLDAAQTVADGGPACTGCCTPACIILTHATLFEAFGGVVELDPIGSGFVVGWNGEAGIATPSGCYVLGGCPTPSSARTWGAIKSLYR